jgi:hypothetical protein
MKANISRSFSSIISSTNLRQLIRSNQSLIKKNKIVPAAIVAVRNPNFDYILDSGNLSDARKSLEEFRKEVSEPMLKAGAVIIESSDDVIVAAFGSPLVGKTSGSVADDAAKIILEIPSRLSKSNPSCIGLDYGKCYFNWSPLTGYTACGQAVRFAKKLSILCLKYKVKTLASLNAKNGIVSVGTIPLANQKIFELVKISTK